MLQQDIYDEGFDEGDDSLGDHYQIGSDLLLDDVNLLEWLQNPAFQLAACLSTTSRRYAACDCLAAYWLAPPSSQDSFARGLLIKILSMLVKPQSS